jgi:hypothetical protein
MVFLTPRTMQFFYIVIPLIYYQLSFLDTMDCKVLEVNNLVSRLYIEQRVTLKKNYKNFRT